MVYFFVVLNALLGFLIAYAALPQVGLFVLIFDLFMLTIGCITPIGEWFVIFESRHWGDKVNKIVYNNKHLAMSIVCLTFSLKVASLVAIVMELLVAVACAIIFCLISIICWSDAISKEPDSFADGCIGSFAIGRLIYKIVSFLSSLFDKIAIIVAKIEFYFLGIEIPK